LDTGLLLTHQSFPSFPNRLRTAGKEISGKTPIITALIKEVNRVDLDYIDYSFC